MPPGHDRMQPAGPDDRARQVAEVGRQRRGGLPSVDVRNVRVVDLDAAGLARRGGVRREEVASGRDVLPSLRDAPASGFDELAQHASMVIDTVGGELLQPVDATGRASAAHEPRITDRRIQSILVHVLRMPTDPRPWIVRFPSM